MTAAHRFVRSAKGFRFGGRCADRCGVGVSIAISFGFDELAPPVTGCGRGRCIIRPLANAG